MAKACEGWNLVTHVDNIAAELGLGKQSKCDPKTRGAVWQAKEIIPV